MYMIKKWIGMYLEKLDSDRIHSGRPIFPGISQEEFDWLSSKSHGYRYEKNLRNRPYEGSYYYWSYFYINLFFLKIDKFLNGLF